MVKNYRTEPKKIYVTGCAGFIGAHLSQRLLQDGHTVIGQDCMTDYYDRDLKRHRIAVMLAPYHGKFECYPQDLLDYIPDHGCDTIIHLAGQPGVRNSLNNSDSYYNNNIAATYRVLAMARKTGAKKVLYASSSSVAGMDSFYAATKAACEKIATGFSRDLTTMGMRLSPTYGLLGRPDMAPWRIATQLIQGETITITGNGEQLRDYTYIDDVVEGIIAAIDIEETCVLDVGRGRLRSVNELVHVIAEQVGKTPNITYVDKPTEETDGLMSLMPPCGQTELEDGIPRMVASAREWLAGQAARDERRASWTMCS